MVFVNPDHLNTPRLVADSSQQTVWKWDQQEPFGDTAPDENPSALGTFEMPLRFPGQYSDAETALHYNYFRDYDPSLGIYKQSDPVGLRGGLNTYAYVGGSPLNKVDPTGEIIPLLLGVTGIVGAADLFFAAYNFYISSKIEADLASALAGAKVACASGVPNACDSMKQLERELHKCTGGLVKSGADLADEVGSGGRYPGPTDVIKQFGK